MQCARTVSIVSLLVAASIGVSVAAPRPLPPGLETKVQALVNGASSSLPAGWKVDGIAIGPHGFDVTLSGGNTFCALGLRAVDDETKGARVGESRSFSVWRREGCDGGLDAAFVEGLAKVDDGRFWPESTTAAPVVETRETKEKKPEIDPVPMARPLGLPDDARRGLAWGALVVSLLFALRTASRGAWSTGIAVFVVALAVRFFVVAPGPIHANDHGWAELRGLAGPPLDAQVPVETDRYGVAHGQVVRSVSRFFGGGAEGALRVGAVVSSFGAAAVAGAAIATSGVVAAGGVAGMAWALLPESAVAAPTESAFPLAAMLLALAIGAAAMAMRAEASARGAWALAATAATACGLELGVTTLAIPGAVFVTVLAFMRGADLTSKRFLLGLAAALGFVGLTAAMHLVSLSELLKFASTTRTADVSEVPRRIVSLGWVGGGAAVGVLAVLGLGVRVVSGGWRVALAWPLGVAPLLASGLIVSACHTDRLRYLALAWAVLCVAAGWVASIGKPLASWAVAAVVGVVLAVAGSAGLRPLASPESRIDAWVWHHVSGFPWSERERYVVRLPPRRMDKVLADFPDMVVSSRVKSLTLVEGGVKVAGEATCLVWIPPACWRFTKEEVAAGAASGREAPVPGLRSACRDVWSLAAEAPPVVPAWPGVVGDDFHEVPAVGTARVGLVACRSLGS